MLSNKEPLPRWAKLDDLIRRDIIRRHTTRLARAAFLNSKILYYRAEIKRLMFEANTPQKRRETLPRIEKLYEAAERAVAKLEQL